MLNIRLALISSLLCLPLMSQAQAAFEPKPAGAGQVIEEIVHPIRLFKYEPALDLASSAIPAKSAEGVVSGWIAAMRRGDFDAALQAWDASSREKILARSKADGRSKESWVAQWRQLYGERKARATDQVRFESAVLIQYEVVDSTNKVVTSEPVVLVQQGGVWQLTLSYANHAVVQGWNLPTKRVQRLNSQR
ncbi:hypothetical protein [Roseateles amylovorans]|uniref:DUF4019 domain-containing protein n=1 Tax=Roseateles amylovorans TaxID=2978473 RepID=A0ABY6AXP9_9BURK|nr:hypothetical protein [Roseateles amylovorans]UXH76068.1 hypothetical protein N4261_13385 [Roseateles amylovorans]